MSRSAFAIMLGLGLALVGCAGEAVAPQSVKAPSSAPASREPVTELDALQRDFDVSESRLLQQLERRRDEAQARRATDDDEATLDGAAPKKKANEAAPAPATGSAEPSANAPKDAAPRETEEAGSVGSACDLTCRALASMQGSADGICRLTSTQDSRCVNARSRLQAARLRIELLRCACRAP